MTGDILPRCEVVSKGVHSSNIIAKCVAMTLLISLKDGRISCNLVRQMSVIVSFSKTNIASEFYIK